MIAKPDIASRFDARILAEGASRYAIAVDAMEPLGGFVNLAWRYWDGAHRRVLRLSHTLRRSVDQVRGEVDWLRALTEAGVPVAYAVPSELGELVEVIDDHRGGAFVATAHIEADGIPPWESRWSIPLRQAYGETLGRLHAVSRGYRPTNPAWTRPHWYEAPTASLLRALPASDAGIKTRFRELYRHLRALPTGPDVYGLTHQDPQQSNFRIRRNGEVMLFDFDDCRYSWYAHDVAIALFFVMFYFAGREWSEIELAVNFLTPFLEGYRRFHPLDERWLHELPVFLKLCEIDLYASLKVGFRGDETLDALCRRFLRDRRRRIEEGVPFVDLDFASLAKPSE